MKNCLFFSSMGFLNSALIPLSNHEIIANGNRSMGGFHHAQVMSLINKLLALGWFGLVLLDYTYFIFANKVIFDHDDMSAIGIIIIIPQEDPILLAAGAMCKLYC